MYPNPQDVLPLPPRPDLEQYKKRAKELLVAVNTGETATVAWAGDWIAALERHTPEALRMKPRDRARRAQQLAAYARQRIAGVGATLSQSQFVMARAHGFASWPRLVEHLRELGLLESDTATFEQAADAIVSGDLATLQRLLAADPTLIRARSRRDHRATLLHYTAANGVENYRQRTPANIVAITRYLLDAGAEVDAEAEMYGGGATTLGLTVTSAHPRLAGRQNELADLLLSRGARMDKGIVAACLANGCPEAASHLAQLGAECSFIDAAGIGRVDLLERAFEERDLKPLGNIDGALVMASWYGERETVRFLLDQGLEISAKGGFDGQTALHVAAYQGNLELLTLLLDRGAPVNVTDTKWGTTPLVWALHAWLEDERKPGDAYRPVLMALVRAGATVNRALLDDDRLQVDSELHAALLHAASGG